MRNPAFGKVIAEIQQLHDAKNSDYAVDGDPLSNFRRCEALGVPAFKGVLVRMTDKWSRIEQLANGKTPKNESLRDSLIDNAVYSLLAVILLDEQQPFINNEQPRTLNAEPIGQQGYVWPEQERMGAQCV